MNLKKIKLLCCLLPFALATYAQVTIGSEHTPREGAILDLKETNTLGINSIRGLNLPRVALITKLDLAPCVARPVLLK